MKGLPNIVSGITADGLALLMQQPPTSTLSALLGVAYENWINQKAKNAYDILIAEISSGKRLSNDVSPDTFFGLLHRYLTATKQGAARYNLRLMAQVLKGSLEQDCPFKPDKLASHADLVANLTRDEIKFLAVFWESHTESVGTQLKELRQPDLSVDEGVQISAHAVAMQRLIPKICETELEFFALGGSVARTGLVVAKSVWGGTRFDVTPRLGELIQLVDLNGSLDREFES